MLRDLRVIWLHEKCGIDVEDVVDVGDVGDVGDVTVDHLLFA